MKVYKFLFVCCLYLGIIPADAKSEIRFLNEEATLMMEASEGSSSGIQQNKRKISGKVVDDATGEELIGVTIAAKGTQDGTITDVSGNFTISVSNGTILEISYVGYKKQVITIKDQQFLNLRMHSDNEMLDEVVVIGYGSMKKSDLTGAVISANIKDFEKSPNTNILQSLQGTVPGLNIGQVTAAGSSPSIQIRGKNTLSGSESVLIVLDGIIYNNSLSSINPNDIESIDVLKDASATAVYGAQAANGVLLITTKRGKTGGNRIMYFS